MNKKSEPTEEKEKSIKIVAPEKVEEKMAFLLTPEKLKQKEEKTT